MESTETAASEHKSYKEQVDETWQRIICVMVELLDKGASLRLLAATIGTRNFDMVYKKLIAYSPRLKGQTGGQTGSTLVDKEHLAAINANTRLMVAMKTRGITPRRWCTVYGFLKEVYDDGVFAGYRGADLEAIANPGAYLDRTGRDSLERLMCDFPEFFEIYYKDYTFAFINPDTFMNTVAFYKNDSLVWSYWCNEPKIELYAHESSKKGVATAKSLFAFKITHETYYHRLQDLNRFNPVPLDDRDLINDILHWRPTTAEENKKKLEKEIKTESARLMETRVGLEWEENTRKLIDQAFNLRPFNRETARAQLNCLNELREMAGFGSYYPKYMDM